jgi:hypothetical protein
LTYPGVWRSEFHVRCLWIRFVSQGVVCVWNYTFFALTCSQGKKKGWAVQDKINRGPHTLSRSKAKLAWLSLRRQLYV